MNWFYALGQDRMGPVDEPQLLALLQEGKIGADTLVWKEGMVNWQRFIEVRPELFGTGEPMEVCAVSGRSYPRRLMIQYQDKWIAAEHKDTFFQRMREGQASPQELVYGGFWIRVGAKMIDGVIQFVFGIIKTFALTFFFLGQGHFFERSAAPNSNMGLLLGIQLLDMALGLAFGAAYCWFFLARYQATPGKMLLGLRVVRADGSRVTPWRCLGRYFAELLNFGIGYLVVAFDDPQRRGIHDHLCDTRVIIVKKN